MEPAEAATQIGPCEVEPHPVRSRQGSGAGQRGWVEVDRHHGGAALGGVNGEQPRARSDVEDPFARRSGLGEGEDQKAVLARWIGRSRGRFRAVRAPA